MKKTKVILTTTESTGDFMKRLIRIEQSFALGRLKRGLEIARKLNI